jgi:hypothetical protein
MIFEGILKPSYKRGLKIFKSMMFSKPDLPKKESSLPHLCEEIFCPKKICLSFGKCALYLGRPLYSMDEGDIVNKEPGVRVDVR